MPTLTSARPRPSPVLALALAFMAGGFLAAYWPVLTELVRQWTGDDDYSHGLLIGPVVAYLVWKRSRDEGGFLPGGGGALGLALVLLCSTAALVGILSGFRTLSNVACVVAVWGTAGFLFGAGALRRYGWELFLLIFLVPIPSGLYAQITMPLQLLVTRSVAEILHVGGIPVLREGNILHLAQSTLQVVSACSGLRSLITVTVLAYAFGLMTLTRPSGRLFLLGSSLPIAVLTNILRVLVLALASQFSYTSVLEGTAHNVLGIVIFLANVGMLTLIAKGISWVSPRRP
ncbi:MAG: exosortase/archaeosortase family protein [Deltaproteobacteria bacterium]|nr:exosortase/archaeosortase family protein [Deltaproteobacteria bacterium]